MASTIAGCMAVSVGLAPTPVTLATGTPGGIYHPVGNAICRMFNLGDKHQVMPCVAVSSDGSVANIRRIESGEANFGLSQTDVAYASFHGEGPFAAAGPDPKLRVLIALYREAFTVVARADTDIRNFQDLRGKRVGRLCQVYVFGTRKGCRLGKDSGLIQTSIPARFPSTVV